MSNLFRHTYEREGNDSWLIDEIIYDYDKETLLHIKDHRGYFGEEHDTFTFSDKNPKDVLEYFDNNYIDEKEFIDWLKENDISYSTKAFEIKCNKCGSTNVRIEDRIIFGECEGYEITCLNCSNTTNNNNEGE